MSRIQKLALLSLTALCISGFRAHASLSEENVLVVYNSTDNDSEAIHNYYKSIRSNVLSFDLNDSSLSAGNITYADFASKIRDPIRTHLNSNNLEETVHVIVLTKNLPHRIQNIDAISPNAGDSGAGATTAYNAGNATFASVDSELTLIQFDLNNDENGNAFDSFADNATLNPYFESNFSITNFDRSSIAAEDRAFYRNNENYNNNAYGWWHLGEENTVGSGRFQRTTFTAYDAGHIYLTARLDAETVDDVIAMIDRAQAISIRQDIDAILLDSDGGTFDDYADPLTGATVSDYSNTESALAAQWPQLQWNDNSTFLIGNAATIAYSPNQQITGPVAHLHSYGVNHTGNNSNIRDYLSTFAGQLVNGASFSAYESFGAKGLGGLGNANQAQVEEWFAAGGTFATGPVWEPFTFGIMKSEIFLDRFLNDGFTFVEAAWCAIPQISWQTVVIGDPLAKATVTTASSYDAWIFAQTGTTPDVDPSTGFTEDFEDDGIANGLELALLGNPTQADTSILPTQQLVIENNEQYLELSYTRSDSANGINYSVNTIEDLTATWPTDGSGVSSPTVIDNGDGTETWTYRRSAPINSADKAFIRLDISN